MASKYYHSGQLPYISGEKKKGRRFFYGMNRSGFNMEMHETVLGRVRKRILRINMSMRRSLVGGTVETFVEMHSVRNAAEAACRYDVIESPGDEA